MVEVTEKPIEVWKVLRSVVTNRAGAVAHFLGTVRKDPGVESLFYECYPEMAARMLKGIANEAKRRWAIKKVSVTHRYGWVEVGEPSVVIAVSSTHRKEAFAACRFVIDRIKEEVPIWKSNNLVERSGR